MYTKGIIDTFFLESSKRRRMGKYECTRLFEERAQSTKVQTTKVQEANSTFYFGKHVHFFNLENLDEGE